MFSFADSFQVREVGTSLPSIQMSMHRHSSTLVIDQFLDLPLEEQRDSVFPNDEDITIARHGARQSLPPARASGFSQVLQGDSLRHDLSPAVPDSGSEDWYRFSHATTGSHMSHIIRGFPAPPETTVTANEIPTSSANDNSVTPSISLSRSARPEIDFRTGSSSSGSQ
jgi:hypothetical protein